MRRLMAATAAVGIIALTGGCTPNELRRWEFWRDHEPVAAVRFARCIDNNPVAAERRGKARMACFSRAGGRPTASEVRAWRRESNDRSDSSGVYEPWISLAQCESGGNWSINTGNGYYGGLQFALSSWQAAGGSGYPHHASPSEQVRRGEILQDMQGWNAWPSCARQIGLL
jgi:Transglycosylase-like domain